MKISLVFESWRDQDGKTIYGGPLATMEGVDLSSGSFHSGTTFRAGIDLDAGDVADLQDALDRGFRPAFVVFPVQPSTPGQYVIHDLSRTMHEGDEHE